MSLRQFIRFKEKYSEKSHQKGLVRWANMHWWGKMLIYLPNDIALSFGTKNPYPILQTRKSMGLKKGLPDLFLAIPIHPYHGLFLELKNNHKTPSESQFRMLDILNSYDYYAGWSDNLDQSMEIITGYLGERLTFEVKKNYFLK